MSTRGPARAHDLVRIDPAAVPAGAPAWVGTALAGTPWVVVRRAAAPAGCVAAGVRGPQRAQRWAVDLPAGAVLETVPPEALTTVPIVPDDPRPALRALAAVADLAGDLTWGPTGSVGFELATGARTATVTSDLDLVVRGRPDRARLVELHASLAGLPCRVDVQVETPAGAVALAELVSGAATVLARTPAGPELVACP